MALGRQNQERQAERRKNAEFISGYLSTAAASYDAMHANIWKHEPAVITAEMQATLAPAIAQSALATEIQPAEQSPIPDNVIPLQTKVVEANVKLSDDPITRLQQLQRLAQDAAEPSESVALDTFGRAA